MRSMELCGLGPFATFLNDGAQSMSSPVILAAEFVKEGLISL